MSPDSARTKSRLQSGQSLPIFRWVGGKRRLATDLLRHLPDDISSRMYVEPFLGAATLLLALAPNKAIVGDLNSELMQCYRYIRSDPQSIAKCLAHHARHDNARHYYRTRLKYNSAPWSAAQAARFIYLNRTCFNGIFRVNRAGEFNVPYGYKRRPLIPDITHLELVRSVLRKATLLEGCYSSVLKRLPRRSFVYLDPPYPPLNTTAFFTHYTTSRFCEDDQVRLAGHVTKLNHSGILFMMSNADTPTIRKLYRAFDMRSLSVTRFVTPASTKHRVKELVIRNY